MILIYSICMYDLYINLSYINCTMISINQTNLFFPLYISALELARVGANVGVRTREMKQCKKLSKK